jgi:hypothetical protein
VGERCSLLERHVKTEGGGLSGASDVHAWAWACHPPDVVTVVEPLDSPCVDVDPLPLSAPPVAVSPEPLCLPLPLLEPCESPSVSYCLQGMRDAPLNKQWE